MENWHSNIFFIIDTLAQQHKHLAVLGSLVSKHATFIKYRLNQIIKSNCVSDESEMKIMIQWVTQSHSSMGFNLKPYENTFWNLMAALKCACTFFWALWLWLYQHVPVMARVFGRTVSVCGSICKIDLCLDIFGTYNCWENLFCQKKLSKTPRSQIPDIFSVPRFQIFWASIPRFQIFWASIPWFQMLIHPPPLQWYYHSINWENQNVNNTIYVILIFKDSPFPRYIKHVATYICGLLVWYVLLGSCEVLGVTGYTGVCWRLPVSSFLLITIRRMALLGHVYY